MRIGCWWSGHQWEEFSRQWQAPLLASGITVEGYEMVRDVAFGFTMIHMRCLRCGDIKAYKVIGQIPEAIPKAGRSL